MCPRLNSDKSKISGMIPWGCPDRLFKDRCIKHEIFLLIARKLLSVKKDGENLQKKVNSQQNRQNLHITNFTENNT